MHFISPTLKDQQEAVDSETQDKCIKSHQLGTKCLLSQTLELAASFIETSLCDHVVSEGFLSHQLTVCEHLSLMTAGGDGSVSGQLTEGIRTLGSGVRMGIRGQLHFRGITAPIRQGDH